MPPHPLLVAPTATPTVVCRVAGTDTVALLPLLPPPPLLMATPTVACLAVAMGTAVPPQPPPPPPPPCLLRMRPSRLRA